MGQTALIAYNDICRSRNCNQCCNKYNMLNILEKNVHCKKYMRFMPVCEQTQIILTENHVKHIG